LEQNKYETEDIEFDKSHKKPYKKSDRYEEKKIIREEMEEYYYEEE